MCAARLWAVVGIVFVVVNGISPLYFVDGGAQFQGLDRLEPKVEAAGGHDRPERPSILNRILSDMDLELPDINFSIMLLDLHKVNCSIQLKCGSISIGNLDVRNTDRTGGLHIIPKYDVELLVDRLASDCWGELIYKSHDPFVGKGSIGLEVSTKASALHQKWQFYWNEIPFTPANSHDSLPAGVRGKSCKPRAHYNHNSFRVIGGEAILSFIDSQVLDALAPVFGPLVTEPLYCLGTSIATRLLSFALDFIRFKADWFLEHELPRRASSISALEKKVRPRRDRSPRDRVYRLDSAPVKFMSAFVAENLAISVPEQDEFGATKNDNTLGINALLREKILSHGKGSDWVILDAMKSASLQLFAVPILNARISLALSDLRINGLDSFTALELFKPIGKYTIENRASMAKTVTVTASFLIDSHHEDDDGGEQARAKGQKPVPFEFSVGVEHLGGVLDLLLGLDAEGLGYLTLGSLLQHPLGCLLSVLANATVGPDTWIDPKTTVIGPEIRSADPLFKALQSATEVAMIAFGRPCFSMMQQHAGKLGQALFRDLVDPAAADATCPSKAWPPPVQHTPFVWRESALLKLLRWGTNVLVGVDGQLNLNKIMGWSMGYVFGPAAWNNHALQWNGTITLGPVDLRYFFPFLDHPASATVAFGNISMSGVDSISELDALETSPDPSRDFELLNNITIQGLDVAADVAIDLIGLTEGGGNIADEITVSIAVAPNVTDALELFLDLFAQIDLDALLYFQPRHFFSPCLAFSAPAPPAHRRDFSSAQAPIGLKQLEINFASMKATGYCRKCSSEYLPDTLVYVSQHQDQLKAFIDSMLPVVEKIATNTSDMVLFGGLNVNFAANNLLTFMRSWCLAPPRPHSHAEAMVPRGDATGDVRASVSVNDLFWALQNDYRQNHYQRPWWIPPMRYLMGVAALSMFTVFWISILLAKRKSSKLRDGHVQRLAQTLIETDYLNTGSSSVSGGNRSSPNSCQVTPPVVGGFLGASAGAPGSGTPGVSSPGFIGSPLSFSSGSGPTSTTPVEGDARTSARLSAAGEESSGDRGTGAAVGVRATGSSSSSVFSNNSVSSYTPPDGRGGQPAEDKSFHRGVVMEFRRRVSTCSLSRTSLLQSPREIVSETDTLYLLGHNKAMILHPSVSPCLAGTVVVLLFINFVMFVSGNFFSMGTVAIDIKVVGDQLEDIPMLSLTLDYCIDLLSEAGALVLFTFVGFCSGVLPWGRVACLGYCFVVPANVLTVEHRGWFLRLLESAGKWTMSVYYLQVILSSCMATVIQVPQPGLLDFLPEDTISATVEYVPQWGMLSFFFSGLLSVILNHWMVYIHDRIEYQDRRAIGKEDPFNIDNRDARFAQRRNGGLANSTYHQMFQSQGSIDELDDEDSEAHSHASNGISRQANGTAVDVPLMSAASGVDTVGDDQGTGNNTRVRDFTLDHDALEGWGTRIWCCSKERQIKVAKIMVTAGLILAPILFVFAYVADVFSFEFMGVAGWGVDTFGAPGDGKERKESLFGLLDTLIHGDPGHRTNVLALGLMITAYLVLIIVAPILSMSVGIIMWFLPRNRLATVRLLYMYRVFNSWNSTNVLCITLLILSSELPKFFDAVADGLSFCPTIFGDILAQLGASAEESVCFGVIATIYWGWYLFFAWVIFSFILTRAVFVMVMREHQPDFEFNLASVVLM